MYEVQVPEGHPLHTLQEEHRLVLGYSQQFASLTAELKAAGEADDEQMDQLKHLFHHLKDSESHYLREENVLFPYLDKHGISGPTKVMWMEHDQIRSIKKTISHLFETMSDIGFADFIDELMLSARELAVLVETHFGKENQMLFNMAMKTMSDDEWEATGRQFDEIGYCCFTPGVGDDEKHEEDHTESAESGDDLITFPTGKISPAEMEAIFNTLPVDITFVDANDEVRYFNRTSDPIFVRSEAAIGVKVQQCHPQKSVHLVNKILEDFKNGQRDVAEFWIRMGEKYVYIRYFAVRDKTGQYLGCMEVTQDIAPIQQIEGEKRL